MSQQLISLNRDLKRLRDEGYGVVISKSGNYLLITNVPYVTSAREVSHGILVSELYLAGDKTVTPKSHVAYFYGEHPCNKDGSIIEGIRHGSQRKTLDQDLVVDHSFSAKPTGGYADHYHKMSTYVDILTSPAQAINPSVTARTFPVIEADDDDCVFNYIDTASSRAEINIVTKKLEQIRKIGIIGLGGTGAYVLDLVAKTPVKEIHIFDRDRFSQHNAFRSPGAPSIQVLRDEPQKVFFLRDVYSNMHRHIIAHDEYLDESNVDQLRDYDFVFICADRGSIKKLITEKLTEYGIPFIDVGMGINLLGDKLFGIVRVTTGTTEKHDHIHSKNRIPFSDIIPSDDYAKNIQIADLNALNAALAVIKWKKLFGFYNDLDSEHHSTYTVDGNMLLNEDKPDES